MAMSRAFGKCRSCKKRTVLEMDVPGDRYAAFDVMRKSACPCGVRYDLRDVTVVRATLAPETECNARCTDATTPNCKCSCGGAHHGENVVIRNLYS